MKKKFYIIISLIIILIIVAISLNIKINKEKRKNKDYNVVITNEIQNQINENAMKANLLNDSPQERMKTYCGQFLGMIEDEKYDEAYSLLNENFKENYFPTQEDFEKYVKEKYPSFIKIDYEDTDRKGEVYLIKVKISSLTDDSFQSFEQNFVVRENDNNDYTISFEKI